MEGLGAIEAEIVHCFLVADPVDPDVCLDDRAVLAQELNVELLRKGRIRSGLVFHVTSLLSRASQKMRIIIVVCLHGRAGSCPGTQSRAVAKGKDKVRALVF